MMLPPSGPAADIIVVAPAATSHSAAPKASGMHCCTQAASDACPVSSMPATRPAWLKSACQPPAAWLECAGGTSGAQAGTCRQPAAQKAGWPESFTCARVLPCCKVLCGTNSTARDSLSTAVSPGQDMYMDLGKPAACSCSSRLSCCGVSRHVTACSQ